MKTFVNNEQNNWTKFLSMGKFIYTNANNLSTGHTIFELNWEYHLRFCHEKAIDFWYKSKSTDNILTNLCKLIITFYKNLYNVQIYKKDYKISM